VVFWGIADAFIDEVVLFFASREEAEGELRAILQDEPGWADKLALVSVDFSAGMPAVQFVTERHGS
jgi:hypothetical protein